MQRALLCKRAWTSAEPLKSQICNLHILCRDVLEPCSQITLCFGYPLVTFSLLHLAEPGPDPRDIFCELPKTPFPGSEVWKCPLPSMSFAPVISGNMFI